MEVYNHTNPIHPDYVSPESKADKKYKRELLYLNIARAVIITVIVAFSYLKGYYDCGHPLN